MKKAKTKSQFTFASIQNICSRIEGTDSSEMNTVSLQTSDCHCEGSGFLSLVFYSGSGPSEAWGGPLGAPPEAAAMSPCFLTPDTMSSILRSNTAVWDEKLNHIHSCYIKTIMCNFMNKQAFFIKDDFVKFWSLFVSKVIYITSNIHQYMQLL